MEIPFVIYGERGNGSCLSGAKGSVYDKHRPRETVSRVSGRRFVRKFRGIISVSFVSFLEEIAFRRNESFYAISRPGYSPV